MLKKPSPPPVEVGGTRTLVLGVGKTAFWALRTEFGLENRTLGYYELFGGR